MNEEYFRGRDCLFLSLLGSIKRTFHIQLCKEFITTVISSSTKKKMKIKIKDLLDAMETHKLNPHSIIILMILSEILTQKMVRFPI